MAKAAKAGAAREVQLQRITGSAIKRVRQCPGYIWLPPGPPTTTVEAELGTAVHTYYETGAASEALWETMTMPERPGERLTAQGLADVIVHVENRFAWDPVTKKAEILPKGKKERDYDQWPTRVVVASADAWWELPQQIVDGKKRRHVVFNDLKTGWPEKASESTQLVYIGGCGALALGLADDDLVTLEIYNATRKTAKSKAAGKRGASATTLPVSSLMRMFDALVKKPIIKALLASSKDVNVGDGKQCFFCAAKPNCAAYILKYPNYNGTKRRDDEEEQEAESRLLTARQYDRGPTEG